jgi:hypothetical protein
MNDGTDGPQTGLPAARELLPCPFCGSRPCRDMADWRVWCSNCGAAVDNAYQRASAEWNTRAPAAPLAQRAATEGGVAPTLSGAEIARLRTALLKYGGHVLSCQAYNGRLCNCGWAMARTALGAP